MQKREIRYLRLMLFSMLIQYAEVADYLHAKEKEQVKPDLLLNAVLGAELTVTDAMIYF